MSTSETTTHPICNCPCGKGYIVKHITTQDNPWSSADVSVEIDCSICTREWRIEHDRLVLRSSEQEASSIKTTVDAAARSLQKIVSTLVANYFAQFSAKTKKAELSEIVRLGIGNNDYRSYLRSRGDGKTIAEYCYGLRNVEWVRSQAQEVGRLEEFNALIEAEKQAEKAYRNAYAKIVRRKIA